MRCIDTRLRAKERQVDTALCTLAACTRGIYHSNVTYLYGRRRRAGGNSLCDSSWCVSGRKGREQGFIGHGYDPMCASSTISRSTNTRWPLLEKEKTSAIGAPTSREQTRLFAFERTFRNDFTCKNGIFDQKQNRVKANSRQPVTPLHQLNGYTVGFLWLGFKSDRFFSRLPRGLLRNANTEYYLLCVELLVVSHSEWNSRKFTVSQTRCSITTRALYKIIVFTSDHQSANIVLANQIDYNIDEVRFR